MSKGYLEIRVEYKNQWVNGIIEIDDYIKAIRSLKNPNPKKWRSVKVLSPNFTDTIYLNFPVRKIRLS